MNNKPTLTYNDFKKQYQLIAKVNIEFSKSYNDDRDKQMKIKIN